MLMGEGEMDVAKRIRTSYRGKVSGKGTGSRVEVGPALTEERKQNTWRGVKVCGFYSNSTEGSTHLLRKAMALEKMNQSPVT